MIFKPFWHTAKLCLVLTKTSACLSRLKVLRPNGCQTQVVLKPVTGWDHDIPIRKATEFTAKFFPYELASGLYKLWERISEKLCSPIQYATSGTWI